jgi:hypothetical protein
VPESGENDGAGKLASTLPDFSTLTDPRESIYTDPPVPPEPLVLVPPLARSTDSPVEVAPVGDVPGDEGVLEVV